MAGYLREPRELYEGLALCIVKPESVEQVSRILRLCNEIGVAVVPQGGNTGLVGGQTPDPSGAQIVLSLKKLNSIREIDVASDTLTIEAGATLSDVQQAADSVDRYFPLSLASEGSCTIGGNLSTNAGGVHVIAYGSARDLTLGVEVAAETLHCFGEASKTHPGIRVSRLGVPGIDLEPIESHRLLDATIKEHHFDARVIETLRIERGIPAWGKEMSEETLPPEVGLDRTHIDYDRGCYPGQETISRLKSIGRVRRLLHTLRSSPGAPLHPGMRVLDAEKKDLGEITSAAEQWDSGSWVALALLPRETTGPLFVLDPSVPLTEETTPISIAEIHGS